MCIENPTYLVGADAKIFEHRRIYELNAPVRIGIPSKARNIGHTGALVHSFVKADGPEDLDHEPYAEARCKERGQLHEILDSRRRRQQHPGGENRSNRDHRQSHLPAATNGCSCDGDQQAGRVIRIQRQRDAHSADRRSDSAALFR
jgi:hypothetical protein